MEARNGPLETVSQVTKFRVDGGTHSWGRQAVRIKTPGGSVTNKRKELMGAHRLGTAMRVKDGK